MFSLGSGRKLLASSMDATFQKEVPQPLPTSLSSLTNPPKSLEVFAYRTWDHELILTGKRPISMCLETEASLVAQLVRIHLQSRRPQFHSWIRKISWRRDRLPTPVFLGFPGGSDGKESACNVGDLGLIPGLGRFPGLGKFPGGEHGNSLQYSCLENPHGQRSLVGYSSWG